MSAPPADSVGVVSPSTMTFDEPLTLESGRSLSRYELVYETYGALNPAKSNAILICHALSGHHHAAGFYPDDDKPGWWDAAIGPGKPIDTSRFYVVCLNNLGGCHGSTGPTSINSETNKPFGPDFPMITVKDWVNSQVRLSDRLGIKRWAAVIGGSLGGMQAMDWAIRYPTRLQHALLIATAPKLTAQNIAFNEVARQAIVSDPNYHHGFYDDYGVRPDRGLRLARMLGHITYLSDDAMADKFGRELKTGKFSFDFDVEFQVESYLRHQGDSFVDKFDANTYLLVTKVLDYFDPAADFNGKLAQAFLQAKCRFLVMSFTSDWRFSPKRSEEIVRALLDAKKPVSYCNIESSHGHDSFLLPIPDYFSPLKAYLDRVAKECSHAS